MLIAGIAVFKQDGGRVLHTYVQGPLFRLSQDTCRIQTIGTVRRWRGDAQGSMAGPCSLFFTTTRRASQTRFLFQPHAHDSLIHTARCQTVAKRVSSSHQQYRRTVVRPHPHRASRLLRVRIECLSTDTPSRHVFLLDTHWRCTFLHLAPPCYAQHAALAPTATGLA